MRHPDRNRHMARLMRLAPGADLLTSLNSVGSLLAFPAISGHGPGRKGSGAKRQIRSVFSEGEGWTALRSVCLMHFVGFRTRVGHTHTPRSKRSRAFWLDGRSSRPTIAG